MGWLWPSAVEEEIDEEAQQERAKVAHHESGHIFACDRFGIPCTEIHVSVNRTYWTGRLQSHGLTMVDHIGQRDSELVVMSMSGMVAEALYYMEELGWRKRKAWDEAEANSSRDIANTVHCVGRSGRHRAERDALRLIEDNWSAVRRLAASL